MKLCSLLLPCTFFEAVLFWRPTFTLQDQCRRLKFASPLHNKALVGHVIENLTLTLGMHSSCRGRCTLDDNCVSYNIGPPIKDHLICQLSDSNHVQHPKDLVTREGFTYQSSKTPCSSSPCQNGGTCSANYEENTFNCLCVEGFIGAYCEKDAVSCKELHEANKLNGSLVVTLRFNTEPVSILCQMGDFGWGAGPWTPIMKTNGNQNTFHFDSVYWTDLNSYNLPGGLTGFDDSETKLPTYWSTPFSKICLGMKVDQQLRFIVINQPAASLHSLIADGQYRATSQGRDTWKTLLGSQGSLQLNCNKEGFNSASTNSGSAKTRIGIVSNEGSDGCYSCDSRIGYGGANGADNSNTCGNVANWSPDNGDKNIKAMGYILAQ
ncbi:uncharacterized protein LOC111342725 isoform X2 [Stylophora pistillata]|uniref:uncharacterized protein LOC111342725 isoform X2 n=1 Tax=Stylophora pistillata TaxID=50429 RepID=UPI000C04E903|nr:uncharacterized protein LOC111342725 isoform X2 [Stylophora pistillata]